MRLRALIFGSAGQVGRALQATASDDFVVTAHDLHATDIRDFDAVSRAIESVRPDIVLNCAAFTGVDAAESQRREAVQLNVDAPAMIASVADRAGVRLIHISTDYVFNGAAHAPYRPDAIPAPINFYGVTKLDGERRVLSVSTASVVVRTAWVHSGGGTNFVRTAVRLLCEGRTMRVVDDQVGTPTRARHLAHALWQIALHPQLRGVLHFTDAGVGSWYDVAVTVLETLAEAGKLPSGAEIVPIASAEHPAPARRPHFSVLDKHDSWRAIGYTPPHWRHGIIASTHEILNA